MKEKRYHRATLRCGIALPLFFCFFLFIGCEQNKKVTQSPTVITKKIVQTPEPNLPVKEEEKPTKKHETAKPAPAEEKPQTVSTLIGSTEKGAEPSGPGSYDPKGRIDPFEPLFKQDSAAAQALREKKRKMRAGPLTPLEKVDLSQLKLVGVIMASTGNKALVQESSGKGFIVKEGTRIGINSGRVIQIRKDRIIVEEEIETISGETAVQKKEMNLQKPPGE